MQDTPVPVWKSRPVVWGTAALLLIMLAFGSLPSYRMLKTWRAGMLLDGAESLLNRELHVEAIRQAYAAYQLAPYSRHVIRRTATLCSRLGLRNADEFWSQLLARDDIEAEDRRAYVLAMLQSGRPDRAHEQASWLQNADRDHPDTLLVLSDYSAATGDIPRSLLLLRDYLRVRPDSPRIQLQMARLLLLQNTETSLAEGRALLWKLARSPDRAVSLTALRLLIPLSTTSTQDYEDARKLLESHPDRTLGDTLLLWSAKISREPAREQEWTESIRQTHQNSPSSDKVIVGRWLNQRLEHAQTTKLIPESEALTRQDLFLVWSDAMAVSGRWKELGATLAHRHVPLERPVALMFQARAARETGDRTTAEALWSRAISEAGERREVLWFMGRYAEKLGENSLALAVYRRLARLSGEEAPATRAMIRLLQQSGQTRDLRNLLAETSARTPHDPAPRNDLAYLNLLLGENIESSLQTAHELVRSQPTFLSYRVTLALGLLKTNRPDEALSLLQVLPHERWMQSDIPDAWKTVYVAALARQKSSASQADQIRATIQFSKLRDEERALLDF
jgi:hypothetical protein